MHSLLRILLALYGGYVKKSNLTFPTLLPWKRSVKQTTPASAAETSAAKYKEIKLIEEAVKITEFAKFREFIQDDRGRPTSLVVAGLSTRLFHSFFFLRREITADGKRRTSKNHVRRCKSVQSVKQFAGNRLSRRDKTFAEHRHM